MTESPPLDVDGMLADPATRVIVCCGSGGVGKTTTAAALALRAAEAGRTVVVLTIDPARRLAQAMGLSELDNDPRPVPETTAAGGRLDAMMLDMKRTFDEIVLAHATEDRAREILANPFYQTLSSSFAGTQEYMAMEKLGQLRARNDWDLIIVDTPPSRSALDFLDAPNRLGSFLDSRFLRLLITPVSTGGRGAARVMGASASFASRVMKRVIATQLLEDIALILQAFESMFGGFRERAQATYDMLKASDTAFVVVAAPEPDALREASYFVRRLQEEAMPLGGLVLNRVPHVPPGGRAINGERSLAGSEILAEEDPANLTAALLLVHADLVTEATHARHLSTRFRAANPEVPVAEVPALAEDVHDLDGLRTIGSAMARDLT